MKLGLVVLMLFIAAIALNAGVEGTANAQNLNVRDTAPPASNAKIGRVLSKARSKAAQSGNVNLNQETINTRDNGGCNLEIGNRELPKDGRLQRGRLGRDEQVVVVPGDVINICR